MNGDVSRDDVSPDRFSSKHSFKVRGTLTENLFWPKEAATFLLNKTVHKGAAI
jgi:hypothetical protein